MLDFFFFFYSSILILLKKQNPVQWVFLGTEISGTVEAALFPSELGGGGGIIPESFPGFERILECRRPDQRPRDV